MEMDGAKDARKRPRAHQRWMIRHDMHEVLDIENKSFEYPWQEEDFIRALRQRNCIGMVAELDDKVVGYMIYELHKTRLHLLNMAVDPEYRRQGIGTDIVEKLAAKLSAQRRSSLGLKVCESNLPAQQFFRTCGLKAVGTSRNFYEESGEDAYNMRFRHLAPEQRVVQTIDRLESVTGTQWELVHKNGNGTYEPRELQRIDSEHGGLVLRTRGVMKNPENACDSLNELWHAGAYIDESSAQVLVPVETISQVRMNSGKDGQLGQEFTASHNARSRSLADRERMRKRDAHDSPGQGGRG